MTNPYPNVTGDPLGLRKITGRVYMLLVDSGQLPQGVVDIFGEDIFAELFALAYRYAAKYRVREDGAGLSVSLRTYVYRSLHNRAQNIGRRWYTDKRREMAFRQNPPDERMPQRTRKGEKTVLYVDWLDELAVSDSKAALRADVKDRLRSLDADAQTLAHSLSYGGEACKAVEGWSEWRKRSALARLREKMQDLSTEI